MGRLHIVIGDDLEKELRKIIGYRKGALSEFISKAIEEKLERIRRGGNVVSD